ncbi:hypothetical protein DHEL01_v212844 [Diaporthe helianthi]|uniref:Glycosyl transferase CAP10 domain-containing protein n=1 Tax=Diaporthe helianthi TaxID=158607 RepID=A0A2P5HET8_DIAHE|nr:hypothetical protein DHEL01_v212844 [Diaporthe helianthi]
MQFSQTALAILLGLAANAVHGLGTPRRNPAPGTDADPEVHSAHEGRQLDGYNYEWPSKAHHKEAHHKDDKEARQLDGYNYEWPSKAHHKEAHHKDDKEARQLDGYNYEWPSKAHHKEAHHKDDKEARQLDGYNYEWPSKAHHGEQHARLILVFLYDMPSNSQMKENPIRALMINADKRFSLLLSTQTFSCHAAVNSYLARRGRPPPPGFTDWYRLAGSYEALAIEEFWDPIYEDLGPFWNLSPKTIRSLAKSLVLTSDNLHIDGFWVRNGQPSSNCDEDFCLSFLEILNQLLSDGAVLPDVEMALSFRVTPKVIVPWDDLNSTAEPDLLLREDINITMQEEINTQVVWHEVFAANRVGDVSHEIRVPAWLYWVEKPVYHASKRSDEDWSTKVDQLIWRGANTGGLVTLDNWQGFHRHRFVSVMNATDIERVEQTGECHLSWAMTEQMCRSVTERRNTTSKVSDLLRKKTEVGFYGLCCEEMLQSNLSCSAAAANGLTCTYLDDVFQLVPPIPLTDMQKYKYLADIDGFGYSATIFREWHDSRLVPWKHFVPLDNRFGDIWGVLDYFTSECTAEDCAEFGIQAQEEAREIGMGGSEWAEKVLRKEDMKLYVYRLVLEYARLMRDDRDANVSTDELCGKSH